MFKDRFEGSVRHGANRERLCFADAVVHLGEIKDEWDFVADETLRTNIASELQKVHFDILLVNRYNVYYSPEAMTMKDAIVAAASVAEAVLEVAVKLIEDEPKVQAIIETRERIFEEFHELKLRAFGVPDGSRVVAGVQRDVIRSRLDRNTKMDLLIRAAHAAEVIDEDMEKKLQQLRRLRNRVHIKTVEELEFSWYTPQIANGALDILEEFRLVAKAWIEEKHRANIAEALQARLATPTVVESDVDEDIDWDVPVVASHEDLDFTPLPTAASYQPFGVDDLVHHNTLGHGLVIGVEASVVTVRFFSDGAVRKLMPQYAPMQKTGVFNAENDIPF